MSANAIETLTAALVDCGWDGTKHECYACGRILDPKNLSAGHNSDCVIGPGLAALAAVEALLEAAASFVALEEAPNYAGWFRDHKLKLDSLAAAVRRVETGQ